MDNSVMNKKRLLLNAEPFGFGPTAAIADCFPHLREHFGKVGYGGPAPPKGKPHRYFFKLYALGTTLDLPPGASEAQVEKAMKGHILAEGQLMGTYGR